MEFKEIIEDGANGEVEVQISPIGAFKGSRSDGSAVPENITKESLDNLADVLNASNEEVLVDVDHKSTKPGAEKDSSATGWLSGFFTNVKGLFAKMKLTKKGRELVENREYRHLSPVFSLDSNGSPIALHSVAMTNTPAFAGSIEPILNSEPTQEEKEMTKEEIIDIVKSVIADMKAEEAKNECSEETKQDEVKNEEPTQQEEQKPEEKPAEEAKNEEVEATKEEIEEVKEEKEVIKEEVLNSAPVDTDISMKSEWQNLHGKEFFDYLSKNKNRI